MTTEIRIGDTFDTVCGYEIVTGIVNDICHTESYEVCDNGELDRVGTRMLTPGEIGQLMKEVDGKNRKVMLVREREEA